MRQATATMSLHDDHINGLNSGRIKNRISLQPPEIKKSDGSPGAETRSDNCFVPAALLASCWAIWGSVKSRPYDTGSNTGRSFMEAFERWAINAPYSKASTEQKSTGTSIRFGVVFG